MAPKLMIILSSICFIHQTLDFVHIFAIYLCHPYYLLNSLRYLSIPYKKGGELVMQGGFLG